MRMCKEYPMCEDDNNYRVEAPGSKKASKCDNKARVNLSYIMTELVL